MAHRIAKNAYDSAMPAQLKRDLPSKPCRRCGQAFAWRKKWARCWDEVRYCSDRCRNEAKRQPRSNP